MNRTKFIILKIKLNYKYILLNIFPNKLKLMNFYKYTAK